MINRNYINNIPDPKTNILHSSTHHDSTNFPFNTYSENEFNNLVLNSNLDNYNTIKWYYFPAVLMV